MTVSKSHKSFNEIAASFNLSIPELIERIERGELVIIDPEALEDWLDLQDGLEALAEMQANGEKPIPWEEVERELG